MENQLTVNRTRSRLEKAWTNKSDRPLALGTYSVSMLAKLTAGEYARRMLSKEPYDFPAYLGWSGNRMGDALLDEAGIAKEAREFNLYAQIPPVALSGHPDGVDVDTENRTITVLETKRFTFPTPKAIEEAKRQALCYAALLDKRLRKEPAGILVSFDSPPWGSWKPFWIMAGDWNFHVQIVVAGAFEPEIHDVPAPRELLNKVWAEFFAKALMVHGSVEAGSPDLADKWDREHGKERPVEGWAEPPEDVQELLMELGEAKTASDAAQAHEEELRAKLKDAMRAAHLPKAVGGGISAAWVQKKTTDNEALAAFIQEHGQKVADFEKERIVREIDSLALGTFLLANGKDLEAFKTKVYQESFTVRSVKTKKGGA